MYRDGARQRRYLVRRLSSDTGPSGADGRRTGARRSRLVLPRVLRDSRVPTPAAVDEYVRCCSRPGAMASAFARYRGTSRQIEHNARHLSRPLGLAITGVGGERVFGTAVAENLHHGAPNVRQEVLADWTLCLRRAASRARQVATQLLRRDVNGGREVFPFRLGAGRLLMVRDTGAGLAPSGGGAVARQRGAGQAGRSRTRSGKTPGGRSGSNRGKRAQAG